MFNILICKKQKHLMTYSLTNKLFSNNSLCACLQISARPTGYYCNITN